MRLSSTEISNSEKTESDFSLENRDAVDEKMGSLNFGLEPLLDKMVEKREKEAEHMVCFDKPADDLEVGMCKGEKSIIMEDNSKNVNVALLPLGSKVLASTKNIIAACAEREIDEFVKVECVTVPFEEAIDLVPVNSNELDSSLKKEMKSSPVVSSDTCQPKVIVPTSPHTEAMKYKKWSAKVEPGSIVDDYNDIKFVSNKGESAVASTIDEDGKAIIGAKKGKRGRKRKTLENSEFNGDVRGKKENAEKGGPHLSGRVLRLRPMTKSGSFKVDESGLSENLVGFKRKMEAECLNQTELKEVNGKSQLTGQPHKKQKHRGRPPKGQGVSTPLHMIDDVAVSKKIGRRGRPPKVKAGCLTNAKKSKLMVGKKINNSLKSKDVKKGPKIHNVHKEDGTSDTIGDNKQKFKDSKEDNDRAGGEKRRQIQQSVRDQIVSILMKAGWTVEHRPRKERAYLDAVYVDLNGGTHWSVTKAYNSIKKRIEDGTADDKEVSAFTPIPDEEISVLFRVVTKVRSDKDKPKKNKKKKNKNKNDKGISEAEIVMSDVSEAPVKKKLKKKLKDGKKKKEVNKSDVKLGSKSLKRQPKVSQKGQQSRKPRLVARSSSKGNDEDDDGCLIYSGKRNILSWMIDLGVVMPGDKVQYGEGRKRNGLLEGKVTPDGIHCSCCNETMNISSFVSHGGGKIDQALKNIYFQSSSFLKCLQESWRKEEKSNTIKFNLVDVEGDDPNDDTCNICGDGGDLICCDGCPSTFHQSCLDIQNFPSGVWHCLYCSCKFCGLVSQMDDSHHAPDMISCCLCEEKFHRLCVQEEDAPNVDSSSLSFCGRKCQELSEQLKTYLGVKFELEDGFSWTLLQRADVGKDSILIDAPEKIVCNSKLAVAFSVMDECFVPIMDERSGVNMIRDVVYNCGSNFRRLDYSGFFTAILERGDDLISAASIRIHGNRLAEMPFIGTRHMYRRQGMCRRLLDAIESALSSLCVGELVIPAIPELYETWTTVFGFKPLKKSKRQTMKSMSMIVFPGTDILQKPLLKNQFADKNLGPAGDDKAAGCITMAHDDNALHLETKPSNPIDYVVKGATLLKDDQRSEPGAPPTSFEAPEATSPLLSDTKSEHVPSDSDAQSSDVLASEHKVAVIKNTFDLNLQPSSNDSDNQFNDQDSFDLSNSRAQVDNNGVLI